MLRSDTPSAYWLLVCLPNPFGLLEPLQADGNVTLLGMTLKLGLSPLLFNLTPWFVVAIGVIFFSMLFWFPLARNLTRSISKMTRATESIAKGRFDIQIADSHRDELGRLGLAINRMARA